MADEPSSNEPSTAGRVSEPEGPQGITADPNRAADEAPPRFNPFGAQPQPQPEPEQPGPSTEVADLKAENARLAAQLAQADAQNRAPRAHQATDEAAELVPAVIADGEDLAAVATRVGLTPDELYARNHRTIEDEATARGFLSSESGRLIWPGTVLYVPPFD